MKILDTHADINIHAAACGVKRSNTIALYVRQMLLRYPGRTELEIKAADYDQMLWSVRRNNHEYLGLRCGTVVLTRGLWS